VWLCYAVVNLDLLSFAPFASVAVNGFDLAFFFNQRLSAQISGKDVFTDCPRPE
jgi:hypothetical protein